MQYPKIQSVWKRDPKTPKYLLEGQWTTPEFEYLKDLFWEWTEKVDGMNIRVIWDKDSPQPLRFAGRTDRAQIPTFLLDKLFELFPPTKFADFPDQITLFGEGYGEKIQKGGGNYGEPSFVLFDVFCGMWLKRDNVNDIAAVLGIRSVPVVGFGTLPELVKYAEAGPDSCWGDFTAEGFVARPTFELLDRRGNRIITKIKYKDFNHGDSNVV